MSKAFVNEDAAHAPADTMPDRPEPLPITAEGQRALREELDAALRDASEAGQQRARVLARILETVFVVPGTIEGGRVTFGSEVVLEGPDGEELRYRIVGPDETRFGPGRISVSSPVARALLGKEPGDSVVLRRPKGDLEVTIMSVAP